MKRPMINSVKSQDGYVLLLALITSMALFIALSGILSLSMINLASVKRSASDISAQYVAEAGIDKAVFEINNDPTYPGTNTACPLGTSGSNPVTLFDDSIKGKATYETCTMAGSIPHEILVYAVGKVYASSTSAYPIATRRIKATVQGSPAGDYALQTGPGGLTMTNSAAITNGPVYVGGFLTMSNSSSIGSPGAPISVGVANARCPAGGGSTYPAICAAGVQPNPITITNSARIYGNVSANGQSISTGMSHSGLVASTGVSAPSLPDYDRDTHKAAASTTLTSSAASCSGSQNKTWPANVHITGDVTLSNSCVITVNGDAWIDGRLTLSNSSVMRVAASATNSPTIMVDGSSGIIMNNSSSIATNSAGVGFYMITFHSAASCTPNCVSVTGTDLYNSHALNTITVGNQGLAAGTKFYARWTALTISNGGTVGSIMAQKITLGNSGNLSFSNTASTQNYTYDIRYYELQ